MKILFAVKVLQTIPNGAAAYTYRVLTELFNRTQADSHKVELFLLYDSTMNFVKDYPVDYFLRNGATLIDSQQYDKIADIIDRYQIDSFFIGLGQRYANDNLQDIKCHSVVVIHDVFDCEIADSNIESFIGDDTLFTRKHYVKVAIQNILKIFGFTFKRKLYNYKNLIGFYNQPNVDAVTVSDYSCASFRYFFPFLEKEIHVLYSPHKVVNRNNSVGNNVVQNILMSGKKFYLMVNTNRMLKNARFAINTFLKTNTAHSDRLLVTVGYPKSLGKNHIVLPYLSESDLDYLFQNAFALIYPSLEEGFGYPPLEALRHGTPVLSSNVCSMPEIYGDAVLYFSPIHNTSLFMKLKELDDNYDMYVQRAKQRYLIIKQRQEEDLDKLINLILSKKD